MGIIMRIFVHEVASDCDKTIILTKVWNHVFCWRYIKKPRNAGSHYCVDVMPNNRSFSGVDTENSTVSESSDLCLSEKWKSIKYEDGSWAASILLLSPPKTDELVIIWICRLVETETWSIFLVFGGLDRTAMDRKIIKLCFERQKKNSLYSLHGLDQNQRPKFSYLSQNGISTDKRKLEQFIMLWTKALFSCSSGR